MRAEARDSGWDGAKHLVMEAKLGSEWKKKDFIAQRMSEDKDNGER